VCLVNHCPLKNRTIFPKSFAIIGASCVVLLAAIYAHITISKNPDYAGSLAILDRVFDLALAGSLGVLTFSIGSRLSKVLQLKLMSVAEELSFSIFLGTGALGLSILALGLLGLLKPLPVALLILSLLIALRSELTRFVEVIRKGLIAATCTRERAILSGFYLFIVLVLIIRASSRHQRGTGEQVVAQ